MYAWLTHVQFLSFFKMSIKYIAITFFLSLVIMLPVHVHDTGNYGLPNQGNYTSNSTAFSQTYVQSAPLFGIYNKGKKDDIKPTESILWMYLIFVYLFSILGLYLIIAETKRIIRIRQDYLGSQSTVTDRTIRLSGIPEELRSEDMIKEAIDKLAIGKVESVLLCRDWRALDDLVVSRKAILRKLEEAWTIHMSTPKHGGNRRLLLGSSSAPSSQEGENSRLLDANGANHDRSDTETENRRKTRIWYGFLKLQSRKVDAIHYYEEKLRKTDEQIESARNKVYKPTPLAFVTLDSTAAAVSLSLWGKEQPS